MAAPMPKARASVKCNTRAAGRNRKMNSGELNSIPHHGLVTTPAERYHHCRTVPIARRCAVIFRASMTADGRFIRFRPEPDQQTSAPEIEHGPLNDRSLRE